MQICMPVNLRSSFYESADQVQMENNFAPLPVKLPLENDLLTALRKIRVMSNQIRYSYPDIYATYILFWLTATLVPSFIHLPVAVYFSKPFTLAFSNVPGSLKPMQFGKTKLLSHTPMMLSLGHIAVSISMMTYVDTLRFTMSTDTCVTKNPGELVAAIQEAVFKLLDLSEQKKA